MGYLYYNIKLVLHPKFNAGCVVHFFFKYYVTYICSWMIIPAKIAAYIDHWSAPWNSWERKKQNWRTTWFVYFVYLRLCDKLKKEIKRRKFGTCAFYACQVCYELPTAITYRFVEFYFTIWKYFLCSVHFNGNGSVLYTSDKYICTKIKGLPITHCHICIQNQWYKGCSILHIN